MRGFSKRSGEVHRVSQCEKIYTPQGINEHTGRFTVANIVTISYDGYAGDGKIDTNGFFSYFYVACEPEQLKKANYITFQYYDKISEQTISRKISLAGFTKAYNSIRH
jgi:hypothetical protein